MVPCIVSVVLRCILLVMLGSANRACNGAEEFCALPLQDFSFPATHNSGSFDLGVPGGWEVEKLGFLQAFAEKPIEFASDCFYENHKKNYREQLQQGVRFFSADVCLEKEGSSEIYNCHGRDGTVEQTAYGEKMETSLQSISAWLAAYPNEIVGFTVENKHQGLQVKDVRHSVEKVFGECVSLPLEMNLTSLIFSRCLKVTAMPTSITLGELVDKGLRFIFFEINYHDSFSYTLDSVASIQEFSEKLWSFARSLNNVRHGTDDTIIGFKAFRVNNKDLFIPKGPMIPQCNEHLAKTTNAALLPDNHVVPELDPPDGTICKDAKCGKYRSVLEVAHLEILRKGYRLGYVAVDYSKSGNLRATMRRINMINFRNFKNLPEPNADSFDDWISVSEPMHVSRMLFLLLTMLVHFCAAASEF